MEEAISLAKTLGVAIGEIILVIYVCVQYIKKNYKKFEKINISLKMPEQNIIDMEIMDQMDCTKEILNADRIHVYEFHNGDHYADYRSAYRFSCSYEVTKANKPSYRIQCSGLPISIMPRFINKLTTEGVFYCDDIKKLKDTMTSTYEFKNNIGIKAFYDIVIRNKNGNVIGFVAIQWDKNTIPNIDEREINKLVWLVEKNIQKSINLNNK